MGTGRTTSTAFRAGAAIIGASTLAALLTTMPAAATPSVAPHTTLIPATAISAVSVTSPLTSDTARASSESRRKAPRWMGPPLTRLPANNRATCAERPGPFFSIPSGASSCTWVGIGTLAGDGLDGFLIPPGGGMVTSVQVKVGPVTGRMQLVVVRAMRQKDRLDAACCFYRARSQIFTPKANAITTVKVNLVMEHSLNKSSNTWNFDSLGLSVPDGNVPMPAFATGSAGGPRDPGVAGFYPRISGGREIRVDGGGISGYQVLIRARYTPR